MTPLFEKRLHIVTPPLLALVLVVGQSCAPGPIEPPADGGNDATDGVPTDTVDRDGTRTDGTVDGDASMPDGDVLAWNDDLALELGRLAADGESFEAYPDEDIEIELVNGFQGGYHIEPSMYLTGIDQDSMKANIYYEVERVSDGRVLNRRESYRVEEYGWLERPDGFVHHSNPVIFDISQPDEVVGDVITLGVRVEVDGVGKVKASTNATVIDEES